MICDLADENSLKGNVFGILPDSEFKWTRPALFHAPVDFEFSDKSKYQYNQAQIVVDRTLGHRRLGAIGVSIKVGQISV